MITRSSDEFLQFCTDLLRECGNITYKRMFSGFALYCDNTHVASIVDNTLFLVVAHETMQGELKNKGSLQFSYQRKGRAELIVIKNWWSVPDESLEDPELLKSLVFQAFPELSVM